MSPLPDVKSCVRNVSFQVFMESLMNILVLWDRTPCGLAPFIVYMLSYHGSLDCWKEKTDAVSRASGYIAVGALAYAKIIWKLVRKSWLPV